MLRADPTFRRFARANQEEVVSRLPIWYRWGAFAIVGTIIVVILGASRSQGIDMSLSVWFWIVLGATLYIGLFARNGIVIDVAQRTYVDQKGLFPLVRTQRGSLSEFDGIYIESWSHGKLHTVLVHATDSYFSGVGTSRILLKGEGRKLLIDGRGDGLPEQRKIAENISELLGFSVAEEET